MKAYILLIGIIFTLFSCTHKAEEEKSEISQSKTEKNLSSDTLRPINKNVIEDSIPKAKEKPKEQWVEEVEYTTPPIVKDEDKYIDTTQYLTPTISSEMDSNIELFNPDDLVYIGKKTQHGVEDIFGDFDPQKAGTGDDSDKPVKVAFKASYPGGENAFNQFLKDNFVYPERCKQAGINGFVQLRFVVDKYGKTSDVKALKETVSCTEFTQEAIRVIKLTKWIPGNINGKFFTSIRTVTIELPVPTE